MFFLSASCDTCEEFKLFWKWRQTCLNLPLCQLLDKRTYGGFILLWSFQGRCKGRGGLIFRSFATLQLSWPIFTHFDRFWAWHRSREGTPRKSQPCVKFHLAQSREFRVGHSLQLSALAIEAICTLWHHDDEVQGVCCGPKIDSMAG